MCRKGELMNNIVTISMDGNIDFIKKGGIVGKVLNFSFNAARANQCNVLGSLKSATTEFKSEKCGDKSLLAWARFYNREYNGKERILNSTQMTKDYMIRVRDALNELTSDEEVFNETVKNYVKQVVYSDTYSGLLCEKAILEDIAKRKNTTNWRLSTEEEERLGIDGYVDDIPYQVKPRSFRDNDFYISKVNGILVRYSVNNDTIEYSFDK